MISIHELLIYYEMFSIPAKQPIFIQEGSTDYERTETTFREFRRL